MFEYNGKKIYELTNRPFPTAPMEYELWKDGKSVASIAKQYGFTRGVSETFAIMAGGKEVYAALREAGAGARRVSLKDKDAFMPTEGGVSETRVKVIAREVASEVVTESRAQVRSEFSERLRAAIREELAQTRVNNELKVTITGTPGAVTIKQSHMMLKESLRRVGAGFNNVLCVGPAGSGKTTLAAQMALCLKREFGFISLSGGTTEGALLGRISSTGKYLPALFVTLFEKGGVFLLDEVDAADANVLLVLNSALANGELAVPARVNKPIAKRHKNFTLVAAANTWGTGADWQYVGRNQLDAAFLSRFAGSVLKVDYDEGLERSLVTTTWYDAFIRVRHAASTAKLRRVLGTREMLAGDKLLRAGYTMEETWHALTAGWSVDEVRQAQVAQWVHA